MPTLDRPYALDTLSNRVGVDTTVMRIISDVPIIIDERFRCFRMRLFRVIK